MYALENGTSKKKKKSDVRLERNKKIQISPEQAELWEYSDTLGFFATN